MKKDITKNRHKGNPASVDANEVADQSKSKRQAEILEFVAGKKDFTMKDVCAGLDLQPHQVSGRLSELKEQGVISGTGQRRDRCEILELV